jgi:alpha-glucoside transport system permease protein
MSSTTAVTPNADPGSAPERPLTGPHTRGRRRARTEAGAPPRLWVKLVIAFICLLWIIPTLGLLITSFRTTDDANGSGWWTVFTNPASLTRLTFQNYSDIFSGTSLGQAFVNNLAISIPATIIPILIAAFAAYAFTFMSFPGRDWLLILIVALLVVPNQVAFVPLLKIYGSLGITGTFLAVWGAHIGFGMSLAVYLIRNYMSTLPREVIESAKVDGASHFQTFWKLIVPMSTPALASFAIFQFLWVWNDFLVGLIFIGPGDNQTLNVALNGLLGQQGQGWQLLTAGAFFTMLLPIIVFLSLQRYFVRGLTAGSVKG